MGRWKLNVELAAFSLMFIRLSSERRGGEHEVLQSKTADGGKPDNPLMGFFVCQERGRNMVQLTLKQLLLDGTTPEMVKMVGEMHPADVAETLAEVPPENRINLINSLPSAMGAIILQEMELQDEEEIIRQLASEKSAHILNQMYTDEAADLLAVLPETEAWTLIALMGEKGTKVKKLLAYEEDTSGGLMATEFITVKEEQTIEQVLKLLRDKAPTTESGYYLYVEAKDQRLVGVVSLRTLVTKPLTAKIGEVMYQEVISVPENMDQEEVARLFDKYGFLVLPVVDQRGRLIGVITLDDVLEVAEEEATEDIHKAASIIPMKETYINAGIWTLFNKRVIWLLGLIFINLLSSQVLVAYEEVLSTVIALTFFIPLLIATGGNTGSQSATLIVRALTTGDIKITDWAKVLFKEIFVGTFLGIVLGIAGMALGLLRGGMEIGLIVGLTMVLIVLFSNIVGMIFPIILTRIRLDPAVASSPLITSICDATGLLIYFSIASWVLKLNL